MKIVNLEELSIMPNGTVFSKIDNNIHKFMAGDFNVDGLNIMCGHNRHLKDNEFNGVMHLCNYVSICKDENGNVDIESDYSFDDYNVTDTTKCDYEKSDMFVVYDKTDVIELINVLQWALSGCESELLVRSEFVEYQ